MVKKKELKTVDLDDLQSFDQSEESVEEEIVVNPSISAKDLDSIKKHVPARVSPTRPKSGAVMDDGRELAKNKRERQLEHITSKYRFDRKKLNWKGLFVVSLVIMAGLMAAHRSEAYGFISETTGFRLPFEESAPLKFPWIDWFGSYYPLICFVLLALIPMKRQTQTMVEVFFEGLSVPSEIFPVGRSSRRRLTWRQIQKIDFKNKSGVPYVQLFDRDSRLLGEMRLDVDNPKGFYRALSLYAPKEHILRKLINN